MSFEQGPVREHEPKTRLIVIGLGNEFLSDDGLGIYAVRLLKDRISQNGPGKGPFDDIVFEELAIGGLGLLDFIIGYSHCIIIDAILTGNSSPGTIRRFDFHPGSDPVKLTTSHQIDLGQVLALGKLFTDDIPHRVTVFGVEVSEIHRFELSCTAEVARAIPDLVETIYQEIINYIPCETT